MFIPINRVFNWWCDTAGMMQEMHEEIRFETHLMWKDSTAGDDETYIDEMWADLDDVQELFTHLSTLIDDVNVNSTELMFVPI